MLRRATVSDTIIRGVIPSAATTEFVFHLSEKGVRDQLLAAVAVQLPEPAASKFLYYLDQLEPNKLDGYSSIQFTLMTFHIVVQIHTDHPGSRTLATTVFDLPAAKPTRSWLSWMFA